jgi:TROVE domain
MSKFAGTATTARPVGPTATIGRTVTHEGGAGFVKDPRTELFTLALTNFVGESTFYESGASRDRRFAELVRAACHEDPAWVRGLIPWMRHEANMRSASVVAAVEASIHLPDGRRQILPATLLRGDEPAEALAYALSAYGRQLPKPTRRGIADAAVALYSERTALKYDSNRHAVRMGDVIELCHPKPKGEWQSALFQYLLDVRHGRPDPRGLEQLTRIARNRAAHAAGEIDAESMTWEEASSHTAMDAAAWEKMIPSMGYMALLRNLRNFEQAGVSQEVLDTVAAKLSDHDEVARSRQFPFRFYSAHKATETLTFGPALEAALESSLANIPDFPGKTLVMVDVSGSMQSAVGGERSKMSRKQAAALFGAAVAKRSNDFVLAAYATGVQILSRGVRSTLRTIEAFDALDGVNGHSTNTWPCVEQVYRQVGPFDRILIFTDLQHHPSHAGARNIPAHVPIYVWDLGGYKPSGMELGSGRYLLGGLSDQSFKLISMLENFKAGTWPWESE